MTTADATTRGEVAVGMVHVAARLVAWVDWDEFGRPLDERKDAA